MGDDAKEEAKPIAKALGTIDKAFDKFSSYLSDRISTFVAFLFVLIAVGAFYGYLVVPRFPEISIYLLLTPLGLALVAYYNRTFATILFAGLLLITVLL